MYAIVQVGSSQYRIAEGDVINAQQVEGEEGKSITLGQVLFFTDGKSVKIGKPFLKDVKITAKIVRHHKGEKLLAFKSRRRKDWSWRRGSRAKLTALNITKINAS